MTEFDTRLCNAAYNAGFKAFGQGLAKIDTVYNSTAEARSFNSGHDDAKVQAELVNRVHAGKGR